MLATEWMDELSEFLGWKYFFGCLGQTAQWGVDWRGGPSVRLKECFRPMKNVFVLRWLKEGVGVLWHNCCLCSCSGTSSGVEWSGVCICVWSTQWGEQCGVTDR